jgi:hypothetical protein
MAEVGVLRGNNAWRIMKICKPSILYLVDAWANIPGVESRFSDHARYAHLWQVASKHPDWCIQGRIRLVCAESGRAATELGLERVMLDAVYFDAANDFVGVRRELDAWWPLVRPGGVMGGHHYHERQFPGAVRAVQDFLTRRGMQLEGVSGSDRWPNWWARKPRA